MNFQTTLKEDISCVGIGLHSGRKVKMTLKPAAADSGIVFRRVDRDGLEIPARAENLSCINYATCLAHRGVRVETVEHLLAALSALSVDNVVVELDAAEVPIMDGSAAPFIYLIHEAGIRRLGREKMVIKITRPITVARTQGGADKQQVSVYPADSLKVSYTISFDHPLLRHQQRTVEINESAFSDEVAPARTFGFLKEVEQLRQSGLALGGSLDNAVVVGETGVLNNPLRFPDEFVRHKILDVVGDLALLGRPLLGHVVAVRAGHQLHTELVRRILHSPESWELVNQGEPLAASLAAKEAPVSGAAY
jgi:UDP-3-O-[3-hydroxymyristoyl] N-acetylglucosamine deacetylase